MILSKKQKKVIILCSAPHLTVLPMKTTEVATQSLVQGITKLAFTEIDLDIMGGKVTNKHCKILLTNSHRIGNFLLMIQTFSREASVLLELGSSVLTNWRREQLESSCRQWQTLAVGDRTCKWSWSGGQANSCCCQDCIFPLNGFSQGFSGSWESLCLLLRKD